MADIYLVGFQKILWEPLCEVQPKLFKQQCWKCGEMFKKRNLYLQHKCMTGENYQRRCDHSKEKEDLYENSDVTLEKLSNGNILISFKYLEGEGALAHLKDLKTSYFGGSMDADPVNFPVIKTCQVIGVSQLVFSNGFNNNVTLNQLMRLAAGLPVEPDVIEVYFRDLFARTKPFVYIPYMDTEDRVDVPLGKWLVSMRYVPEKKHIYMTVFKVSKDGRKVDIYFLDPQNEHWDKIKLEGKTSTFYEGKVEDALKVLKGLQWETEEPSVIEFVSCKVEQCKDFEDDGMTCISYCVNYMRNLINLVQRGLNIERVIKKIPGLEDHQIGVVKREVFDFVLAKSRNEKVLEFRNVLNSLKC